MYRDWCGKAVAAGFPEEKTANSGRTSAKPAGFPLYMLRKNSVLYPGTALQAAGRLRFSEGYGLYMLRKNSLQKNSVLYQGTTLVVP
jgi:hypothetical protein